MRQEYDLEKKLKKALTQECADMTASRDLKDRIDAEILERQKEADMKHLSVKKLIIGVAAGCLLVSGGVFAAGHAVSLSSHSYLGDGYKSFSELDKAEAELGYQVDAVEAFENGYRFKSMSVTDVQGEDDNGNAVYTFKSMDIQYGRGGDPSIGIYIEKPMETQSRTKDSQAVRQVGDITVCYDTQIFKFVPPDYELTEEDKAKQENGELAISYGSAKVQEQTSHDVIWEKDGIQYHILGFDVNLSAEEMLDMAEEIIGTK